MIKSTVETFSSSTDKIKNLSSKETKKSNENTFTECLYDCDWQQALKISKKIFEAQSEFQKILIFITNSSYFSESD